jgi:predicted ATPase
MSPHRLPMETTPFIGREHDLALLHRLLDTTRLLTLVGPPGTGKTRLALQLAREVDTIFHDRV